MGFYIKGMEMPEKSICVEIFADGSVHEFADPRVIGIASSVPAHGDLIERKVICLTDFEIIMCDGNYKEGMKMLLEKIESAPTVIPAEEDK